MTTTVFKVFLASPNDTKEERRIVHNVVEEINSSLGEHHNFFVRLLNWENDSYPDFGKDGQDVINKQIGADYDIFIGIMWKRFGTPTNRAESGTAEEFENAYDNLKLNGKPKIMFYFNNAPIPQEEIDIEQFQKVQTFKKKLPALGGYYWTYDTLNTFEKEVRKHLQKHLLQLTTSISNKKVTDNAVVQKSLIPEISYTFSIFLNDPGVNFTHSKVDFITLDNIYICPEMRDLNETKKTPGYRTVNLEDLSCAIEAEGIRYVIIGNESSGKTAATKFLYKNYFNYGLLPVYIKGTEFQKNIRQEAVNKIVQEKINEQYQESFEIEDFDRDRFILIIDDFHKSAKGNNKYWATLMSNIESLFRHVIVTGNTLMPIENVSKHNPFRNFKVFSILEFGPILRSELVTKWYSLGIEPRFFDKNELLRQHDNAIGHIKTIMGKNYIPAYPFYLLSMLQALESGNVQNQNYSVHGFYYELIINEAFGHALRDKKEISLYYNYLTTFCYYLFENDIKQVTLDEFNSFHLAYCSKHDLTYKVEIILHTFETAKLLEISGNVCIKEKYIYYFFVAKYISNHISKPEIKDIVIKMIDRIFKDEYASIIMFVTHLSKDEFIIETLINNANSIFHGTVPAKLEQDITIINDLIDRLPEQVLELVEVDQKRKEELDAEEIRERDEKEKQFETEQSDYDHIKLDADISQIDLLAKLNLAVKTIDLLGQVTKKHWGELDGEKKLELVLSTYNLGLRMLNFYLTFIQTNYKDIIQHLSDVVLEKHIKDRFELKEAIEEATQSFIFKLCFLSSWGITKRISNSIGYDKLKNTFQKALLIQPSNAVKLIDISIKLGYAGIPMAEIEEHKKEMQKYKLTFIILQNLVIDHLYMFDSDYRIKDQVCSVLGISMKDQLRIDATSKVKRNR